MTTLPALRTLLALFFIVFCSYAWIAPPSPLTRGGRTAYLSAGGNNADVDVYRNLPTSFLGNFLPTSSDQKAPSVLDAIDWGAEKRKRTSLQRLSADLFLALTEREWFVTGNVDPSFFDDAFAFQDPDVKISGGVRRYAEGVNKLFQQGGVTRGQIISCVVNVADTITVTWRLEGRVNLGPGVPIKAFIVFSDLRITPDTGLVVFQEDRFSLPGWDIILSAFLPGLPFLAPPAAKVEPALLPALRRKTSIRPGDNLGGDAFTQALFSFTETFSKFLPRVPTQTKEERIQGISSSSSSAIAGKSVAQMEAILVKEYENIFWVTGNMDLNLWEDDCTFADPFSSFGGPGSSRRFQRNAAALGSLVRNPRITLTSVETLVDAESSSPVVKIGWAFSSKLALPWRPLLAAAGTTSHFLSPGTGKIRRYEEVWKSRSLDVVRRLFVPTPLEEL